MQNVVDMASNLTYPFRNILWQTCGSDLLYLSIVFGIVIEELIRSYNLSSR